MGDILDDSFQDIQEALENALSELDDEAPKSKGGEGSGNFGHEGRPREVGGSGEGGGNGKPTSEKPSGREWDDSLSESEKDHLGVWQGSGYSKIRNAEMGQGNEVDIERAKAFNAALDKDGAYEGVTYRGLHDLDDASYNSIVNSTEIEWKASSSATKDKAMGEYFARGKNNNVVFRIQGKTGVDISSISELGKEEKEVILRKGTKYKVLGRADVGNYTYVNLKES